MSTIPETPKAECLCAECNRPMRPRGVLLKEMPGTMAWGHSGKCKSCVQPNKATDRKRTPKPPAEQVEAPTTAAQEGEEEEPRPDFHLALAISGLDSFLAARRRRLGSRTSMPVTALAAEKHRRPAQAQRPAAPRPQRKAA